MYTIYRNEYYYYYGFDLADTDSHWSGIQYENSIQEYVALLTAW